MAGGLFGDVWGPEISRMWLRKRSCTSNKWKTRIKSLQKRSLLDELGINWSTHGCASRDQMRGAKLSVCWNVHQHSFLRYLWSSSWFLGGGSLPLNMFPGHDGDRSWNVCKASSSMPETWCWTNKQKADTVLTLMIQSLLAYREFIRRFGNFWSRVPFCFRVLFCPHSCKETLEWNKNYPSCIEDVIVDWR